MAFDKLEFDDIDNRSSNFELLSEDDLVPSGEKRRADPSLMNYSKFDTAMIGAGERAMRAARGVKDLGLAVGEMIGLDGYKEKREELAKTINEERALFNQNIGSDQNPKRNWLKGGQLAADIGMGVALPFTRGKTIAQTIAKNTPIAAAYEGTIEPGSWTERGKSAGLGAIGSGIGIGVLGGLGKGYEYAAPRLSNSFEDLVERTKSFTGDNSLRKPLMNSSWKDQEAVVKQKLAESIGAPVSIGDINGNGVLRMVEQGFANESQRGNILKGQVNSLEDAIGVVKNNMSKSVDDTSKKMTSIGNDIFAPVQQKIGKTSILINPSTMHAEAKNIKENFSALLEPSFYDKSKIEAFNNWIDSPYPLNYNEFRNFQQIIGKASARAKDLVNKGEIERGAKSAADAAYSKSYDDFKSWGQSSSPKTRKKYAEIVEDHEKAMNEWKRDVLPFDNDVSSSLKLATTPEETVAILLNLKNKSTLEKVVSPELAKHSPQGKHLYEAVRLLNRAGESMSSGVNEATTHPSDIISPLLTGIRKGVSNLTSTKGAKDLYYGKFDHLLPNDGQDFVPRSFEDMLGQLGSVGAKVPIGYAREQEDFSEAALNALLLGMLSGDEAVSPGSVTQDSDRGIQIPNSK